MKLFCFLLLFIIWYPTAKISAEIFQFYMTDKTLKVNTDYIEWDKLENKIITQERDISSQNILCKNIVEISGKQPTISKDDTKLILGDNSVLYGHITNGTPRSIIWESPTLGNIEIELTQLKEIVWQEIESQHHLDMDCLYFKNGDTLEGLIESVGQGIVTIEHKHLGNQKEYFENLAKIVFVPLDFNIEKNKIKGMSIIGILQDFSFIHGNILNITNDGVTILTSFIKHPLLLPWNKISNILFESNEFIYISDLDEELYHIKYTPYFNVTFPAKKDKNQQGGSIVLNNRYFYKGWGVCSRTEIIIQLQRKFQRFQCTVGLDDSVLQAYAKNSTMIGGNVNIQVWTDSILSYHSEEFTIFNKPVELDIDIRNVYTLKLLVDFGENAHVHDFVNWTNARLIR